MEDNTNHHSLDLSYLHEMVGDDPEFIIEVFETFKEQTPIYMAELENALADKDWKRVAEGAHKIKPTLTYIGRSDVKDSIQSIENDSRKAENLNSISRQVEALQLLLDEIYIQLQGAIAEIKVKYKI